MPHDCINGVLSDDKRTTKAMTSQSGSTKHFKQVMKTVINVANKLLKVVQRLIKELSLKVDFPKGNFKFPGISILY